MALLTFGSCVRACVGEQTEFKSYYYEGFAAALSYYYVPRLCLVPKGSKAQVKLAWGKPRAGEQHPLISAAGRTFKSCAPSRALGFIGEKGPTDCDSYKLALECHPRYDAANKYFNRGVAQGQRLHLCAVGTRTYMPHWTTSGTRWGMRWVTFRVSSAYAQA